jgi:hypothetical protein
VNPGSLRRLLADERADPGNQSADDVADHQTQGHGAECAHGRSRREPHRAADGDSRRGTNCGAEADTEGKVFGRVFAVGKVTATAFVSGLCIADDIHRCPETIVHGVEHSRSLGAGARLRVSEVCPEVAGVLANACLVATRRLRRRDRVPPLGPSDGCSGFFPEVRRAFLEVLAARERFPSDHLAGAEFPGEHGVRLGVAERFAWRQELEQSVLDVGAIDDVHAYGVRDLVNQRSSAELGRGVAEETRTEI